MNDELEWIWKETVMVKSGYCLKICLHGWMTNKIMKLVMFLGSSTNVLEDCFTSTSRILLSHLLACWVLARLIFDPENGGDTFLRNVCLYAVYTMLCARRNL
jgi:hypothetical protein